MTQNLKYDLHTAFWEQLSQHVPVLDASRSDTGCLIPFKMIFKAVLYLIST